ncbi:MAG: hypothetical protein JWQ72_1899 [Polaromonas sp.]|nr:hypothetical protein [Polaromonas sp.]
MDGVAIANLVAAQLPAITAVAGACLAVLVSLKGLAYIRKTLEMDGMRTPNPLDSPHPDPWDGYTAADDARDRAAAGLDANPNERQPQYLDALAMRLERENEGALPYDADFAYHKAEQEEEAAAWSSMSPYEKWLSKATPEEIEEERRSVEEQEADGPEAAARQAAKNG